MSETTDYPSVDYTELNKSNTVSELGVLAVILAVIVIGGYFATKYR